MYVARNKKSLIKFEFAENSGFSQLFDFEGIPVVPCNIPLGVYQYKYVV